METGQPACGMQITFIISQTKVRVSLINEEKKYNVVKFRKGVGLGVATNPTYKLMAGPKLSMWKYHYYYIQQSFLHNYVVYIMELVL